MLGPVQPRSLSPGRVPGGGTTKPWSQPRDAQPVLGQVGTLR